MLRRSAATHHQPCLFHEIAEHSARNRALMAMTEPIAAVGDGRPHRGGALRWRAVVGGTGLPDVLRNRGKLLVLPMVGASYRSEELLPYQTLADRRDRERVTPG